MRIGFLSITDPDDMRGWSGTVWFMLRALQDAGADVVLVGGVACNGVLRERMRARLTREGRRLLVPPPRWCTDNAAMIAGAAHALVDRTTHHPADRRLNASGTWQIT